MGWSALIESKKGIGNILNIAKNGTIWIKEESYGGMLVIDVKTEFEITGYLYVGELAGNEPIPEGQKFRVKVNGKIGRFENYAVNGGVKLRFDNESVHKAMFCKSEIEPVF